MLLEWEAETEPALEYEWQAILWKRLTESTDQHRARYLADFFQKPQGRMTGILTDYIDTAAHKITDTQGLPAASIGSGFDFIPKRPGGKSFDDFIGMHKITAENFQQSQGARQVRNSGIFTQCHRSRSQMQSPRIR